MKKILKFITVICLSFLLILIIVNPKPYISGALEGLKLWALVVLPALLPFFFFTTLLSKLGLTDFLSKIFKKPCKVLFRSGGNASYAFIMSLLSGYPVGAKVVSDLKTNRLIGKDEATRLACLCSTSGPLFIIGSVGVGMFNDNRIGICILLAHVLSAFSCGIIFRFYGKSDHTDKEFLRQKTCGNLLYDCVYSSVISVLIVGGFICVFNVIISAINTTNLLLPIDFIFENFTDVKLLNSFLYGLIECTTGCKMLSKCVLSTYSVAFASSLISIGGLSVWVQSIAFLSSAKVNVKIFCFSKITQGILSFIFSLLLFPLFRF